MMKRAGIFFMLLLLLGACGPAKRTAVEAIPEKKKTKREGTYGSPDVKQELQNNAMFKITKYSKDKTYGYTERNPVMVGGRHEGPLNERRFLNALTGPNGEEITYERLGSCCPFKTKNAVFGDGGMLDQYRVLYEGLEEEIILYINLYDSDTLRVPVGFTLRGDKKTSMQPSAPRPEGPVVPLDMADFLRKQAIAHWLFLYDAVAWWTSDSVMQGDQKELERLGREWFCYQDESEKWHAIYGKYEKGEYDLVFHYVLDSTFRISRGVETPDTCLLHSCARALVEGNNLFNDNKIDPALRFNQYVRKDENGNLTVYFMPAFQPNRLAVYGGEFIYVFDPEGKKQLKEESYRQERFRGFQVEPPREITLDYSELNQPTLGAMFFAYAFARFFTRISIETRFHISSLIIPEGGTPTWIHYDKYPEEEPPLQSDISLLGKN